MRLGMKNLSFIVKCVLMTPWCPTNKLEWYSAMILSTHVSGIVRTAASFSGVILNNNESSRMYYLLRASTFFIAALEDGNLFCDKYKNMFLK